MKAKVEARITSRHHLDAIELECSWCGRDVPVPEGDFSSVCIECGAVMFRPVATVAPGFGPVQFNDSPGEDEARIAVSAV